MAEKGNPSPYTGRLKEEKEKLKGHEINCKPKIKKLEEEIETLKRENNSLQDKISTLETDCIGQLEGRNKLFHHEMNSVKLSNDDLIEKLESTTKQLERHGEKLKEFELSEDELIIRQLCSSVQENILKIVLQEYFNKIQNKSTEYIEDYIKWQITNKKEQKEAKTRWEKLRKEIKWDEFLIKQLQPVKDIGNDSAHPSLTEENIEKAKIELKKKEKLTENMVEMVDKLKNIWEETNSKLPQNGPRTSTAEGQDQSGQQNPPT